MQKKEQLHRPLFLAHYFSIISQPMQETETTREESKKPGKKRHSPDAEDHSIPKRRKQKKQQLPLDRKKEDDTTFQSFCGTLPTLNGTGPPTTLSSSESEESFSSLEWPVEETPLQWEPPSSETTTKSSSSPPIIEEVPPPPPNQYFVPRVLLDRECCFALEVLPAQKLVQVEVGFLIRISVYFKQIIEAISTPRIPLLLYTEEVVRSSLYLANELLYSNSTPQRYESYVSLYTPIMWIRMGEFCFRYITLPTMQHAFQVVFEQLLTAGYKEKGYPDFSFLIQTYSSDIYPGLKDSCRKIVQFTQPNMKATLRKSLSEELKLNSTQMDLLLLVQDSRTAWETDYNYLLEVFKDLTHSSQSQNIRLPSGIHLQEFIYKTLVAYNEKPGVRQSHTSPFVKALTLEHIRWKQLVDLLSNNLHKPPAPRKVAEVLSCYNIGKK